MLNIITNVITLCPTMMFLNTNLFIKQAQYPGDIRTQSDEGQMTQCERPKPLKYA